MIKQLMTLEAKGISLQQKQRILRNNLKIRKIERVFSKAIHAELRRYFKAAADMQRRGLLAIGYTLITAQHTHKLEDIFTKYYTQIFRVAVPYTEEQFKDDLPDLEMKSLKLYEVLLQKYITQNLLLKCSGIAKTSEARVKKVVSNGLKAGENPDSFATDIARIGRISFARAALISRTESYDAMNYSQIETAREFRDRYNVEKLKKWIAITDNRVRETHLEMNDEDPIGIDEQFDVGGYPCDRPHDESLPAEEVINCRCNLIFVNAD